MFLSLDTYLLSIIYDLLSIIHYLLITYYLLSMWDMYIYIIWYILKPTSCPVPARRWAATPRNASRPGGSCEASDGEERAAEGCGGREKEIWNFSIWMWVKMEDLGDHRC